MYLLSTDLIFGTHKKIKTPVDTNISAIFGHSVLEVFFRFAERYTASWTCKKKSFVLFPPHSINAAATTYTAVLLNALLVSRLFRVCAAMVSTISSCF